MNTPASIHSAREQRESRAGAANLNELIPQHGPGSNRKRYLLLLYAALGLIIVFWIPYFVPMQPAASASYHFGFNNRTGILLLFFFLGSIAVWTRGTRFPFLETGRSQPAPLKILAVMLVAVLVGCCLMYAFAARFGGFGESSYEIDRVWLLSQGKAPYTDFEWPFGASFLYVPLFFSRLFSIDVVRASYLFWGLNFLLGTVLLFAVINMIDYPTTKKTSIFLLVMAAAYPAILNMGTHYALLRHIAPLFLILVVHRALARDGVKPRILAGLLALIFTVLLLLISPETAVAHAFGCICMFLLAIRPRVRALTTSLGLGCVFGLVFWIAARFHVLDTMRASGGGADSFPIVPGPHILLFFAGLFLCASYVCQRLRRKLPDNTIGLIAYSAPMTAAALGRCDPGHVLLNGAGIFLACLFYVSNSPAAWRWCRNAFLVFIVIVPTISGLWLYRNLLANVCLNILREGNDSKLAADILAVSRRYITPHLSEIKRVKLEKRLESIQQHSAMATNPGLSELYPEWHGEFAAPFGYRPNRIGSDLDTRVDYGFYEGLENANTPAAILRKINDLAQHPQQGLLLPMNFDQSCQVDVPSERQLISILFLFPYRARASHTASVYQPLCDYIRQNYRIEKEGDISGNNYSLWVAKSSE